MKTDDPGKKIENNIEIFPMFTCQECGHEFPPKMSGGEIIDITCKCGQSYNDELAKYGSEELLGR